MAEIIAALALEKKALDVVILDLRKLDALTDYFVICTGEVDQHVRAIADYVQDEVKKRTGDRLLHALHPDHAPPGERREAAE